MRKIAEKDRADIIALYRNSSIEDIATKYKISSLRVKSILINARAELHDPHKKIVSTDDYIEKNAARFPKINGYHYLGLRFNKICLEQRRYEMNQY